MTLRYTEDMYTIDQVCALFGVSVATLRRWRVAAGLELHIDPVQQARRLYDDDQVLMLAAQHGRVALVPGALDMEQIAARLVQLECRVRDLEHTVHLVQHPD